MTSMAPKLSMLWLYGRHLHARETHMHRGNLGKCTCTGTNSQALVYVQYVCMCVFVCMCVCVYVCVYHSPEHFWCHVDVCAGAQLHCFFISPVACTAKVRELRNKQHTRTLQAY